MKERRFGRVLLLPLIGIGVLSVLGCPQSDGSAARTSIVVLFDLSESTNSADVRDAYCQSFSRVLSSVSHGDDLVVAWITESSATEPTVAASRRFREFDPGTTNELVIRARRAEADSLLEGARDSIRGGICAELQSSTRRVLNTDIMTSLELAERVFKQASAVGDTSGGRILVIMSDMVEDSDRYDFDTLELTRERVREIIQREMRDGRFPDLTGVDVCVAGASSGGGGRYHRIKEFWTAYFDSAGAELVDYGGPYLGCAS